jgi:hypothetical protein
MPRLATIIMAKVPYEFDVVVDVHNWIFSIFVQSD